MLELTASYIFPQPSEVVFNLLVDPGVVASCVPSCEGVEPVGEDRYRLTLTVAVAAITGQYTATVAILDKHPPHSYRLVVDGSGRPGFLKGEATIELVELEGTTTVKVSGRGEVGGLVARVGQRLLGSVSRMMMDRFFACAQSKAQERTS